MKKEENGKVNHEIILQGYKIIVINQSLLIALLLLFYLFIYFFFMNYLFFSFKMKKKENGQKNHWIILQVYIKLL